MSPRYELPGADDLVRLGDRHELAVTIYVKTDPADREKSRLNAKSAVDEAVRTVRARGAAAAVEAALRSEWEEIAQSDVWMDLSHSLALFLADDGHEVYVLANDLDDQIQVGTRFDVGQLVRAVTTPQEAYALTLSADGWNLWHATAASRAAEVELEGEHPSDVADATNRATVRDRGHVRRLVGDEGRTVLLEKYAAKVAEAVGSELKLADESVPLFLFAAAPLVDLYAAEHTGRPLVQVEGAADELKAHEIDEVVRAELPTLNSRRVDEVVAGVLDGTAAGLVATDLADIARAAAFGAVATLVFDFTVEVRGELDPDTGVLTYDPAGQDLLSAVAVEVLAKGGEVIAVRSAEVSAPGWNGTALAGLRHALS
ncbi:MAG: hypothetical protein ACI379_03685 [Nocardioides sp.]|uniref:baeRF11 domain-containing protein n=1 Tax=Nocardioides sp. TaxID=35761 RepID=UPI003F09B319